MRKVTVPILLGVCLLGPGCSFVQSIRRNLVHEACYAHDEKVMRKRHERLARQAWEALCGQYGQTFSEAYRDGFIDGFVDYLTYGGCVSGCEESPIVPAVPPYWYTKAKFMTPAGYQAMEEWFMGFRHGAATAQASGLRNLIVVPVFNPPQFNYDDGIRPTSPDGHAPHGPPDETLPSPRPARDTGGASLIPGGSSVPGGGVGAGIVPGLAPGVRPPGAPNPGGIPNLPPIGPPPGGRPAAPPPGGTPGVPRRGPE
jgi:hypothetical protein